MKPSNPITLGSKWKDSAGNIWEVIEKQPFGKVVLMDRKRVHFTETYQEHIRQGRMEFHSH